jgi:hypothetical protein
MSKKPQRRLARIIAPGAGPPISIDESTIEQIAPGKFSEQQKSELVEVVNAYLFEKRGPAGPPNRELRKYLAGLRDDARRLAEDLDPPSLPRFDALWQVSRYTPARFRPVTVRRACEQLAEAAEKALEALQPGKSGRRRKDADKALIRGLYQAAGGSETFSSAAYRDEFMNGFAGGERGEFLDFAEAVLRAIRLPVSRNTLARKIRKTLSIPGGEN